MSSPEIKSATEAKPADGNQDIGNQFVLDQATLEELFKSPAFIALVQTQVENTVKKDFIDESFIATDDDARYLNREVPAASSDKKLPGLAKLEDLVTASEAVKEEKKSLVRPFGAIVKDLNDELSFEWTPLVKTAKQPATKDKFKKGTARPATDPTKVESYIDELAVKLSLDTTVLTAEDAEAKNEARFKILTGLNKYNGLSEQDVLAVAYASEAIEAKAEITGSLNEIVQNEIVVGMKKLADNGENILSFYVDAEGNKTAEYKAVDAKLVQIIDSIEDPLLRIEMLDLVNKSIQVETNKVTSEIEAKKTDAAKLAEAERLAEEEKARELEDKINNDAVIIQDGMVKIAADPEKGHDGAMLSFIHSVKNAAKKHKEAKENAKIAFGESPTGVSYRRGFGLYLEGHYGADDTLSEDDVKKLIVNDMGYLKKLYLSFEEPSQAAASAPAPAPAPQESVAVRAKNWTANTAEKAVGSAKRLFNKLRRK